ncbi:MAG: phage head morphogenesis protein [Methylobacter tundripaludum]|nr:phage head morphogenesis protein [Methylobacter tundripaludum]
MPLSLSPTQIAFNARGDGKFNKPFKEQTDFFRQKLNLPTERYDDILKAAHDRAFVVAGAMKADLLADLRNAVDKAIVDGKSIQWFRKEFAAIVQKHGWEGWTGSETKAGRDWRTRVIYQTNLSASYAAGRWAQLNDPDLIARRPYWKYVHNDTVHHPRPLHKSWSGTILRYDDPWWQTHFAPNGWGCRCRVTAVSSSEYKGDTAPNDGTYIYKDRAGQEHVLPKGIDYGWDYAPGAKKTTPLKDIADQKLIRLPASIGADMFQALKPTIAKETTLQWHATLDEWLATPQAGRTAVVGGMAPEVLKWLKGNKEIQPVTAEIAIREGLIRGSKQDRHTAAGDALNEMEWRRLPMIVSEPEQILFDTRTGKLLYIFPSDDARNIKLSVEFDPKKLKKDQLNMIVSGFKQPTSTIDEMIRGGLYEIVQ